jgi:hypothetical protein
MTDQQYGDCHFEIYFDSLEGRTPGWGSALRWKDLTWPRSLTTLPILLKGIQHSGMRSGFDVAKALTTGEIAEPGSIRWSRCNA